MNNSSSKFLKIFGRGSKNPKLLFVGQAPGREEAVKDKCFVGPAGQLLVQAIKEYNLRPCYLTNLVKYFPPGDRDPNQEEVKACRPYLEKEISKFKPEIIVLLGNIATREMLDDKNIKITQVSGRVIDHRGRRYFPLLHPSFILRYPKNQASFENHCRTLARLINGSGGNGRNPKISQCSPATASTHLAKGTKVAFDYETTGFTGQGGLGKIRCVSFSDGDRSWWVDAEEKGFKPFLKKFLTSDTPKIAQNVVFEGRVSLTEIGVYPRNVVADTVAMHYLIDENSSHSLDVIAGRYLDVDNWDIGYEMKEKGWDFKTVPMNILGPYCAKDSYYTFQLAEKFSKLMTPELENVHQKILIPLMRICARMEYNGMYLDKKYCRRLDKKIGAEMVDLREKFMRNKDVAPFIKKKRMNNLNMNSTNQMRKIFVRGLKIDITETTEGGKQSIREAVMVRYKKNHPAVEVYIDWKKRQTTRNNFVQKFPKFTDEEGLIHASMNPCFIVTGRLSVTKPPLQTVPTEDRIRNMFRSRWDGGQIASFDFKQLEMRLVASESGEERLLKAFRSGLDVHDLTANLIFGPEFDKDQRKIAKSINFGIAYGVTSYTLDKEFDLGMEKSEWMIGKFKKSYPRIHKWMKIQRNHVNDHGWVASRFGRIRRLGDTSNMLDWQKAAVERQAGNFPIQSMGVDITNISLIKVDHFLRKTKARSKLILHVHDSILIDMYPGEKRIVPAIEKIMTTEVQEECPWLKCDVEVDAKISKKWGA